MKNASFLITQAPSHTSITGERKSWSKILSPLDDQILIHLWMARWILHLLPASNMIHLGQIGACMYTQISSHWMHYSIVKQGDSCVVCSVIQEWVLPCSTQFLVFSVKHLPMSTTCTIINNINTHLFWWVCQELKRTNLCSRRSAKAKRDPAKLQSSWNVLDCGGHCCLYGCSGGNWQGRFPQSCSNSLGKPLRGWEAIKSLHHKHSS